METENSFKNKEKYQGHEKTFGLAITSTKTKRDNVTRILHHWSITYKKQLIPRNLCISFENVT